MSKSKRDQLTPAIKAQFEAQGAEIEWTTAHVAAYLECSINLIYQLCHRREIPHRRINLPGHQKPLFRFKKNDIDEWRELYSSVITLDEVTR
jgi:excisionase family DNA binding protein